MNKPKIISIGFDGPNRSGKGTQIALLSEWFDAKKIPYIVVRGDGSRPNEGKSFGDPQSDWWTKIIPSLRDPKNKDSDLWNQSSEKLAHELIVFRDKTLPEMAQKNHKSIAVLLVDRTLLSRTIVPRSQNRDSTCLELYSSESGISPEDVCPDIIFHIQVPQETLLSRLDKDDPKYDFRKNLILEKYDLYKDAHIYLPEKLSRRIVCVDGSSAPDIIHKNLLNILSNKFPELI